MISKPCSFTFNDVSSEDFGDGLVIYYLGDPGGSYTEPLYTVDLFETRLTTRHDSIYHGLTDNNNTLTRELVFGSTATVWYSIALSSAAPSLNVNSKD